jgi:predicted RNA-binding protein YlxR (DUF448 family)
MLKKNVPIRMCIACRQRYTQNTILRLQQNDHNIIAYQGHGRSFYLCDGCINDTKKIKGLAKRFRQDAEQFDKFLKELIKYG